jgi:hypothetical protein
MDIGKENAPIQVPDPMRETERERRQAPAPARKPVPAPRRKEPVRAPEKVPAR